MENGQVVEDHGLLCRLPRAASTNLSATLRLRRSLFFAALFLQTMQGFGEIQDPRILNREPVRLALEPVSRRAPFDDLIPKSLPAPFRPEEVAILNQVDLKEEIEPGRTLKMPVVHR